MISIELDRAYPTAKALAEGGVAGRVHAKDATLYSFDAAAQECCERFMGWADLASKPPVPLAQIEDFARACRERGFDAVMLIAQGGSSAAAAAVSACLGQARGAQEAAGAAAAAATDAAAAAGGMRLFALDSDSPVCLREAFDQVDPARTLVLASSKSGGTIEMRSLLAAVRGMFAERAPEEDFSQHIAAITDPGSALERLARDEGWLAVFPGEPTVGGRFSALSVFGLVPAALMGVDLQAFVAHALEAERACSADDAANPAIGLAAFLYDNYQAGRDKVALVSTPSGRPFAQWIVQLVAESVGKDGKGILPYIEYGPDLLARGAGDRSAVAFPMGVDRAACEEAFAAGIAGINAEIPRLSWEIEDVDALAEQFVMWEYAVAMCGYMMQVCPFDQPDVQQAKTNVLRILGEGLPAPDFSQGDWVAADDEHRGQVEVRLAPCFKDCGTADEALRALFASVRSGDYFCVNAFLPDTDEARWEALGRIRRAAAEHLGAASCLEIGPRYLHSSGQLYKGGPNTGVFLVLSADEAQDMPIAGVEAPTLGALAKAQATGDAITLADRGRRVVHLHLPDNDAATLNALADLVERVLETA